MNTRIEPHPFSVLQITFGHVVIAAATVLTAWALSAVVLLVFFAVLLACVLRGAADWLAARTGARVQSMLAMVVLGFLLFAAGTTIWIGPHLVRQGQDLVARLSQQSGALRRTFAQTPWLRPLTQHLSGPQGIEAHLAAPIEAILGLSFNTLAGLVVLIVTALYLAVSPDLYVRGTLHLIPILRRPRAR